MSLIHKALRQAGQGNTSSSQTAYNPLTILRKKSLGLSPFWIVGVVFFCATLVVLLWPQTPTNNTLLAATSESLSKGDEKSIPPSVELVPETQNLVGTQETNADIPLNVKFSSEPIFAEPEVEQPPVTKAVSSTSIPAAAKTTVVKTTAPVTTNTAPAVTKKVATQNAQVTASKPPARTNSNNNSSVSASGTQTKAISSATNSVIKESKTEWQALVEKHIAAGEIEKAEAILKQWIGASPKDSAPRIWLARIYINNGFYKAAEPLLTTQKSEDAQGLLGLVYERTARPLLAAKLFEELYRANPDRGQWLLFWALNTENSNQLAKSASLYQNYVNLFAYDDSKLTAFAEQRLRILGGQ